MRRRLRVAPLTATNYLARCSSRCSAPGDFLLNVSVEVSSIALVELCQRKGALYLDTCIEPWPGGYTDPVAHAVAALELRAARAGAGAPRASTPAGPTAVLTHGANPGLVSHFVKEALLDIADATGRRAPQPATRADWAALAQKLGVKVIHIAERDTQVARLAEAAGRVRQHLVDRRLRRRGRAAGGARLGHARAAFPGRRRAARFRQRRRDLSQPARRRTRVRSWTPLEGPYHGFLITHSEAISIADYFTVAENGDGASIARPCITPITRATARCCRCTSSPARTGACRTGSA